MKTIGLIGGTTWHSTMDYYRIINEEVNRRLGSLHSAKILLYSVDFEEFRPPAKPEEWHDLAARLSGIAVRLQSAGADCVLLCANTPHIVADEVRKAITVPLVHMVEETARVVASAGLRTVGLLGTKFTMEQAFYREKMLAWKVDPIVPREEDREYIHRSIFDELARGVFLPEMRRRYLGIIDGLVKEGARGVILGCTEIPMLIKQQDCSVPVFDTTAIHSIAAVDFALAGRPVGG